MNKREAHFSNSLKQYASLDLDAKVKLSRRRIRDWYDHWDGLVYVGFSGGRDSTVLASLAQNVETDIPLIHSATEMPENRRFAEGKGAVIIRPFKTFRQCLKDYGWPVVSKKVANWIETVRKSDEGSAVRRRRLEGFAPDGTYNQNFMIPLRWRCLLWSPFRVSDRCCSAMKKGPALKYERETGRKGMFGVRATESRQRGDVWQKYGCNAYQLKHARSWPIAFWTDDDIKEYIQGESLECSELYSMGYTRSGCPFCLFGCHLECPKNKIQRLAETHPKLHSVFLDRFGGRQVMEYLRLPYRQRNTFF